MALDEQALLRKLRQTFREEGPRKIAVVRRRLYESFKFGQSEGKTEMMRELHNLKGASRIAALAAVNELCELMEKLLKKSNLPLLSSTYDVIMEGLTLIEELIISGEDSDRHVENLKDRLGSAIEKAEHQVVECS